MTNDNLDLSAITPDDIPAPRNTPEGDYVFTVVDYKRSEETDPGFYLVSLRVSEACDGQDLKGASTYVSVRFSFNTIGGRELWKMLKAVNKDWADADPKPSFPDMLEEAVGNNIIAEVIHNQSKDGEKTYVNLKNFRAAA